MGLDDLRPFIAKFKNEISSRYVLGKERIFRS